MLYIITGHSRGFGRGIAEQALAQGAQVRGISRSKAQDFDHENLSQLELDLSQSSSWEQAADFIGADLAQHTAVTLIHNAGIISPIGLAGEHHALGEVAKAVNLNLGAIIALSEIFISKTQDLAIEKRIVCISSGAGRRPLPAWGTYCATKAAVDMFAQVVATEQASRPHPVQIASLAPGVIDTGMQAQIREQSAEAMPGVERFVELKENGLLWSAEEAASRLLTWVHGPSFGDEVLVDLRKV
ncbi:MAG: SDR family NAD(P)-dependent oxidoreductase [Bacteroidia bacterium]